MKLISDLITEDVGTQLVEGDNGKSSLYLEGIFLQDTVRNRNGRVYPKKVMSEAVEAYTYKYIKNNRALGELNHPNTPHVNPERVAIKIESLSEDGQNWLGKAKTTSSPLGQLVKGLVNEDGIQLGVSSRGLGAVKQSMDSKIVQNGFLMTAIDVVTDPSAPNAFVNGIMENKEWIFVDGVLTEQEIEAVQKTVDYSVRRNQLNETAANIFEWVKKKHV